MREKSDFRAMLNMDIQTGFGFHLFPRSGTDLKPRILVRNPAFLYLNVEKFVHQLNQSKIKKKKIRTHKKNEGIRSIAHKIISFINKYAVFVLHTDTGWSDFY